MASLARSREIDLEGELDPDAVVLVVESLGDVVIARGLLEAAHFPMERVRLVSGSGKDRAARIAERYADAAQGRCAVLVDLDERNVPDAQARAREQLGDPRCEVFCAVPVAAAWLFADDRAVVDHASPDEEVQRIVKRLPLPEEIPDPKRLAHYVFGPIPSWQFITHIDIGRAAARSPS